MLDMPWPGGKSDREYPSEDQLSQGVSEDVNLAAVWFSTCNLPAPNDIQRS
jgi:hypothetical protein